MFLDDFFFKPEKSTLTSGQYFIRLVLSIVVLIFLIIFAFTAGGVLAAIVLAIAAYVLVNIFIWSIMVMRLRDSVIPNPFIFATIISLSYTIAAINGPRDYQKGFYADSWPEIFYFVILIGVGFIPPRRKS